MSKKKVNKEEPQEEQMFNNIEQNEVVEQSEVVEEVKEVETPKDPKQQIMQGFIKFYNENVKGHSVVSAAIGKQIVNFFNAYSDSRVIYTGCGSCVATKITYMRKQAKQKYNLEF